MNRMIDVSIVFDNEWLDEYVMEKIHNKPNCTRNGCPHRFQNGRGPFVVKIYKLKQDEGSQYSIEDEVSTFHFTTEGQQREFIEYLPDMSAIDFIFLLSSGHSQKYN